MIFNKSFWDTNQERITSNSMKPFMAKHCYHYRLM